VNSNDEVWRRRRAALRVEEAPNVMQDKSPNPAGEPVEIEAGQGPDPTGQNGAETPATAGGEAGADGTEASVEAALAVADQELANYRDAMLRMQAEMENLRKRLLRDMERSRKFALERIMKDLLQVRDGMERGLEVTGESATVDALREGQQLTLRMLAKVLQDHGMEEIDPLGQPFDPEQHEAMTVMPSAEVEENTVLEVLQKGFRLHDRLLRPARVVVSRRP
jgi:molecular chaperone GrpE